MSSASRAYCERRIERLDRQLAERRPYTGAIWPAETPGGIVFGGWIGRTGPGTNVDDLLEQRAKWMRLLVEQS